MPAEVKPVNPITAPDEIPDQVGVPPAMLSPPVNDDQDGLRGQRRTPGLVVQL